MDALYLVRSACLDCNGPGNSHALIYGGDGLEPKVVVLSVTVKLVGLGGHDVSGAGLYPHAWMFGAAEWRCRLGFTARNRLVLSMCSSRIYCWCFSFRGFVQLFRFELFTPRIFAFDFLLFILSCSSLVHWSFALLSGARNYEGAAWALVHWCD